MLHLFGKRLKDVVGKLECLENIHVEKLQKGKPWREGAVRIGVRKSDTNIQQSYFLKVTHERKPAITCTGIATFRCVTHSQNNAHNANKNTKQCKQEHKTRLTMQTRRTPSRRPKNGQGGPHFSGLVSRWPCVKELIERFRRKSSYTIKLYFLSKPWRKISCKSSF